MYAFSRILNKKHKTEEILFWEGDFSSITDVALPNQGETKGAKGSEPKLSLTLITWVNKFETHLN